MTIENDKDLSKYNSENMDGVSLAYPYAQIAKAIQAQVTHGDPDVRKNAGNKVHRWSSVIQNMITGVLTPGSRTPLSAVPAWVTLDVITGGFATGNFKAGGELLDYEKILLAEIGEKIKGINTSEARKTLNAYFISEIGFKKLQQALNSGTYEIDVPESGALLVLTWLAERGHFEQVETLLSVIAPWFDRLRFYPDLSSRTAARRDRKTVHVRDVACTRQILGNIESDIGIRVQRETIAIWNPAYDRMLDLFLETLEGDMPSIALDAFGSWVNKENRKFNVSGGWPCKKYPDDWTGRARQFLDEENELRKVYKLSSRPYRKDDSYFQLRSYLEICVRSPADLNGRDVGRIRLILARALTKRGIPSSKKHAELRQLQEQQIRIPDFKVFAKLLDERLQEHSPDYGIEDTQAVLQPVGKDEAVRWNVASESFIPKSLIRKIKLGSEALVEDLLKYRIIASGEVLAQVLPQMAEQTIASGFDNLEARRLYASVYMAFRRRRSLLLLNLEKQVQLEELPWVKAMLPFNRKHKQSNLANRQILLDSVRLNFTTFPQALLPNKLLKEFSAFAKEADLKLPLVEEVAADIFMGRFSAKFLEAARLAAGHLQGSLYERYYDIDYARVMAIEDTEKNGKEKSKYKIMQRTDEFAELCAHMSGQSNSRSTAANGAIIEWQQIITTQNLAALCLHIDGGALLTEDYFNMAKKCYIFLCNCLSKKRSGWHDGLIKVKNSAYAWRQMIFFMSQLSEHRVAEFLEWTETHLHLQNKNLKQAIQPAMIGLQVAAKGKRLDREMCVSTGAQRFLGWSTHQHWLLAGLELDSKDRVS